MNHLSRYFMPNPSLPLANQLELSRLALCIYHEARGESDEGKVAVGWVVMNRLFQQQWHGKQVDQVVLWPFWFSAFTQRDPQILRVNDLVAWDACFEAAAVAYSQSVPDPTDGADHYCRFDVNPSWKKKLTRTKKIGNHEFYRSTEKKVKK